MLANLIKSSLSRFPPIGRRIEEVRRLRRANATQAAELSAQAAELAARHDRLAALTDALTARTNALDALVARFARVPSPGLTDSDAARHTERLLAHAIGPQAPTAVLGSHPADDRPNRTRVAARLIDAYHAALRDEALSPLKREGDDMWTGLLRSELPELLAAIDRRDPEGLARYLQTFGTSYVWFGGITTCVDGYSPGLAPEQVALTYLDKLVCLAESLGVLRIENPESGPWGENLRVDPDRLVDGIAQVTGIDPSPPLGIIHTDGLQTGRGLFHYRHVNALHAALRVAASTPAGGAVCEFGGGLGITALYARRLGVSRYTILDLPITCLLAGHYLLHALGEDAVSLYGEPDHGTGVRLLPYWDCLTLGSRSVALTLNQDSLPEIADNLVQAYLHEIRRITTDAFLSINHESDHPRTVARFVHAAGGYTPVYRARCWVREGYVEELFRPLGSTR
jgi:hypothetical protein